MRKFENSSYLDTSHEHFHFGALINERRCFPMDRKSRIRDCIDKYVSRVHTYTEGECKLHVEDSIDVKG